jgi:hypothetical protein
MPDSLPLFVEILRTLNLRDLKQLPLQRVKRHRKMNVDDYFTTTADDDIDDDSEDLNTY